MEGSRSTKRGGPQVIVADHGPEFISRGLDCRACQRGVRLHFIAPGKPEQNALVGSFNGKFRDECLSQSWFADLSEVREKIKWSAVTFRLGFEGVL